VPSRTGLNMQINTNTDSVKRISICPPKGYYQGANASYVSMPASDLGNAAASQVLSGVTFTSENGLKASGSMPNQGAVSQSLGINGTYTVPAGYHNGSGKVTQSITTKGAATYTPGTAAQTIAAGQYLSGAQTVAAIPSNWYNANNQQTVFSSGSFGPSASLGAYYANYSGSGTPLVWKYSAFPDNPVNMTSDGLGIRFESASIGRYIIFRAAFPATLKYIRFRLYVYATQLSTTGYLHIVNPATMQVVASTNFDVGSTTTHQNPRIYTIPNDVVSALPNGYFLAFQASLTSGYAGGLRSLELSSTAF